MTAAHACMAARTFGVHALVRRGCHDGRFLGVGDTGASSVAHPI